MSHHALTPAAAPPAPLPAPAWPGLIQRLLTGRHDLASVFIGPMVAQWNALQRLVTEQRPDALLCDVAFTGAVPLLLSSQPRPPVTVCGVGPLMLSSPDTPPFGMGWQPRPGKDYRAMNQVVSGVLFRDVQARFNEALRSLGAPRSPAFVTDWPLLADRVAQLSIPELEYPRTNLPPSVSFAGPVLPPRSTLTKTEHPHRRAKTVVHVTQGTWDNADLTELVVPTAHALGSRNDVAVVVATGRTGQTTLPMTMPHNAFVTDYARYSELLPAVDVMVTNGGFGGVHHALSLGIPLVVAGAASDKPEVAARVAYSGAGIDLRTSRPTARDVRDAVDRILTQPSYRRSARRLAREMQRYNAFDHIANTLIADQDNTRVG